MNLLLDAKRRIGGWEGILAQEDLHSFLLHGLSAIERPRDERALGNAILIPRERNNHPRIVMPDANLLPVEINPQSPGTSVESECSYDGRLRLHHEVG